MALMSAEAHPPQLPVGCLLAAPTVSQMRYAVHCRDTVTLSQVLSLLFRAHRTAGQTDADEAVV